MNMKKRNELPETTQRILEIIDDKFDGNVLQFSLALGLKSSSKINRLFSKDKRNGNYPIPSSDIIVLISKSFDISTDWLLKGDNIIKENKHVNNITIDSKKINGDGNVTNSSDVNISNNTEFINIIKEQQNQINKLLELLQK